MRFLTLVRALTVRIIFAVHGIVSIWRLYVVTEEPRVWYIALALVGLAIETAFTIKKNGGHEWKWFCPSVFFYLLSVVPAIWFLELQELARRIQRQPVNITLPSHFALFHLSNNTHWEDELKAKIDGLGLDIAIPLKMSSDQWLRVLEQFLLLFLILGRWLLPKGKLTHDQLSQLLLVYIGTAADIVEFFEAFKEKQVRYNAVLCHAILGMWSWSLLQFTLVLTATKGRRDHSRVLARFVDNDTAVLYCTPDVYGIIISILMQDLPFLVLRLLLIFKYNVLSYTNMFFTCKNTLVILLLLYRLTIVQVERRYPQLNKSYQGSKSKLYPQAKFGGKGNMPPNWYDYTSEVLLIERDYEQEKVAPVQFTLKRHIEEIKVDADSLLEKISIVNGNSEDNESTSLSTDV